MKWGFMRAHCGHGSRLPNGDMPRPGSGWLACTIGARGSNRTPRKPRNGVGWPQNREWLGYLYYKGEGVRQDDREAVKWFRLAADQGSELARCYLEQVYTDFE